MMKEEEEEEEDDETEEGGWMKRVHGRGNQEVGQLEIWIEMLKY